MVERCQRRRAICTDGARNRADFRRHAADQRRARLADHDHVDTRSSRCLANPSLSCWREAFLAAVLLALAIERTAFRPLRAADPATLLISSFAVSFFLEQDADPLRRDRGRRESISFRQLGQQVSVGGIRLQGLQLVTIATQRHPARRTDLVPEGDTGGPADARSRRGLPDGSGAWRAGQPRDRGRVCIERYACRGCLLPRRGPDRHGPAPYGAAACHHCLRRHGDRRPGQPDRVRRLEAFWSASPRSCCKRCSHRSFESSGRPSFSSR